MAMGVSLVHRPLQGQMFISFSIYLLIIPYTVSWKTLTLPTPFSSWPFSSPLYSPSSSLLHFNFQSYFPHCHSLDQPGSCELLVTLPTFHFSVLQWSTREICTSPGPTGRSFVLIWRHFLKERPSLLLSSASIKPWLWVKELTVPSISPSTRSRGKKNTGHTLIFFTMHVIHLYLCIWNYPLHFYI